MRKSFPFIAVIVAIVVLGVGRVAMTDRVFAQIIDEPIHVLAGLEWLENGTYRTDIEHPPLARVLAALPLYVSGVRLPSEQLQWMKRGNAVLTADGRYVHNLALARIGNLFLLALAIIVAALWARHVFGDGAAILAALITACTPALLGHAGVATTPWA